MTDDTTTDETVTEAIEQSADELERAETVAELRNFAMELHDMLDDIKTQARHINGELSEVMEGTDDDDLRENAHRANMVATNAYQRVDRGDHQILRGL